MPTFEHSQESFQGGELSHRLRGHASDPGYRVSLGQCSDWEITPQGSIVRRGGSVFNAMLPNDPGVRLIPMRMSDEQDYVLVLTGGELRIYSVQGGVLVSNPGSTQDLIVNGDFSTGTTNWNVQSSGGTVQVIGGVLYLKGGAPPYVGVYQNFTVTEEHDVLVKLSVKASSNGFIYGGIGAGPGDLSLTWPSSPLRIYIAPAAGPQDYQWSIHLTPGTYHFVVYSGASAGDGVGLDDISVTYSTSGGSDGYVITAPWLSEQLATLQYAAESAGDRMYFAHRNVRPHYIQRSSLGAWSLQPMTFTNAPTEWAEGNWPSVVEYYQSRLWLAATPQQRNTIWGSRTGNAFDYTDKTETPPGSGTFQVLETDLIKIPAATKGAVHWLSGRQALLAGTDLDEHSIRGGNGMLKPADFDVKDETSYGSKALQATPLGEQVLFVSRDGRKARVVDYLFQTQSWKASDLTFVAEHLTRPLIHEAHHARDPNGTVVLVLEDGTLACCTFDKDRQIIGWWTADLHGEVLSAAVSNGPQGSIIHLAVQRASGICLEFLPMSEFHPDRVYLDSAITRDVSTLPAELEAPFPVIGLDHLEGETVDVILDGAYEGQQVVSSGGIGLARRGSSVTVGLPFRARAMTLPPSTPDGQGGFSPLRARKCWVKAFVRINESELPLVASYDPKVTSLPASARIAADRTEDTPMDSKQPAWTGIFGGSVEGDWEADGQLVLESDLPFRTEILAVFGSIVENEV